MAPVILQTEVHCLGCARKIRKALKSLHGVENVWASPDTGLVVVAGWADASKLQRRIQCKIRRPVTIVSDGAEEPPPPPPPPQGYQLPPPYGGMVHLGPQHYTEPPPLPAAYPPYQRRYVSATTRQYVPPGEPSVCFEDEQPGGCCVQ